MEERPEPLALLVCDQVIQEQGTNKKSLIGTFNLISTTAIPCIHPRLFVFVAIHNGSGEQTARLRMLHDETEEEIVSIRGKVKFNSPLEVQELAYEIKNLPFPKAGLYSIEFFCDDRLLLSRRFTIKVSPEQ